MKTKVTIVLVTWLLMAAVAQQSALAQGESGYSVTVELFGAERVPAQIRQEIVAAAQKQITGPKQVPDELGERLRDEFQQHGYFKVLVQSRVVTSLTNDRSRHSMTAAFDVEPGEVFRLDHIEFSSNKVFDSATLRPLIPMKDGELFNVAQMRIGIQALRGQYARMGYINFTPVPDLRIDDDRHLMTVNFDLDEGDQFRFGKLVFKGTAPNAATEQKLVKVWRAMEGSLFDPNLPPRVLEIAAGKRRGSAIEQALADEIRRGAWITNLQNQQDKTIDLQIEFGAKNPRVMSSN
jgi:hypothetical protein